MAEVLLEDRPELAGKSAQCMSAVAASCLEGQIGLAASSHSQHTACRGVLHLLHSHRTAEIARRCCNSSGRNCCLSYQSLTLPTICKRREMDGKHCLPWMARSFAYANTLRREPQSASGGGLGWGWGAGVREDTRQLGEPIGLRQRRGHA